MYSYILLPLSRRITHSQIHIAHVICCVILVVIVVVVTIIIMLKIRTILRWDDMCKLLSVFPNLCKMKANLFSRKQSEFKYCKTITCKEKSLYAATTPDIHWHFEDSFHTATFTAIYNTLSYILKLQLACCMK